MIFPTDEERGAFSFRDKGDVVAVLSGCALFEFGIFGADFDWFLWFEPHGYLLGRGVAADWVDALRLNPHASPPE
ncbi:hypothetical protein KRR26_05905 [Corallococcus sp. M34]|uniref:hypothetical protein n=1 Tax=Citreicoccus inhibens TaxID=2849499 RepID=UPI001C214492|nr:hypothetical protein [Citreicoccus inhibens]MBU8895128.1 hypothetical protein [Citreicoccus inhibens]